MTDSESARKQYTIKSKETIESQPQVLTKSQAEEQIKKMEDILGEGELLMFQRFKATFDLSNARDRMLASDVVDFVFRQITSDTLQGFLTDQDLVDVEMRAVRGLGKLGLPQTWPDDLPPDMGIRGEELMRREIIVDSAINFMHLLFTRIHRGRHLDTVRKEIDSKRPPGVILGGK